jgi:hypothetical protein
MAEVRDGDWSDKSHVLKAVIANGENLQFADPGLRKDREVVLAAVAHFSGGFGKALCFADEKLRDDLEIVMQAVSSDGRSLEFASSSLQKNRDIVFAAVRKSGGALKYADKTFWSEGDLVLIAMKSLLATKRVIEWFWEEIPNHLKKDKRFLLDTLAERPDFIEVMTLDQREKVGFFNANEEGARLCTKFYLHVPTARIFDDSDDWRNYEIEDGLLCFRCEASLGIIGIEGTLDLWVPPVDYNVEAWEGSRAAGESDWWACLSFLTVPSGEAYEAPRIVFYYGPTTFFDQSLRVIKIIELEDEEYACQEGFGDGEDLVICKRGFLSALNRSLGAKFYLHDEK